MPDDRVSSVTEGESLVQSGRFEEALAWADRRRARDPRDDAALIVASVALERLGRADEAARRIDLLLTDAASPTAYIEGARLAAARSDRVRRDELLQQARARFPDATDVLRAQADAAEEDGESEEAKALLSEALRLNPTDFRALQALGSLRLSDGASEEAMAALLEADRLAPALGEAARMALFARHYLDEPRDRCFEAHRSWARRFGVSPAIVRRKPARRTDTIRLGYLSPDFRDHAVMRFLGPVLTHHDRARFDVRLYSTSTLPADDVTANLVERGFPIHDLGRLSPFRAAQRLAEDGVDVVIDLAGHTQDGGLLSLPYDPAPVRLTWLGYPDTTGLALEGRITDAIADPPGAEAFHTEPLLRLTTGWTFASLPVPVTERPVGRPLRLGTFAGLAKLGARTLDLWAEILRQIPEATLWLRRRRASDASVSSWVDRAFTQRGIDPSRIVFRPWSRGRGAHLASHADLDIALDPFPYNGTTTTCDALWMGLPVVALEGDRHVSRVGASLLSSAGLGELIARTEAEYVGHVVALARDDARLAALRSTLRERLCSSRLGDALTFTRGLEEAVASCVSRAVDDEAAGRRARPGERLVDTTAGPILTAGDIADPVTWALLEHGGRDELDCELLAELARDGVVLEIGAATGVLTLAMSRTAARLSSVEPDPMRTERVGRSLAAQGLNAASTHALTPSHLVRERATWLADVTLLRAEAVMPLSALRTAIEAARPIVALRPTNGPLADDAAPWLTRLGYECHRVAPALRALVPHDRDLSDPSAHLFWIPVERIPGLREAGLMIEAAAGVPAVDARSEWVRLPFVEGFGLGAAPLPASVSASIAARDLTRSRAERHALDLHAWAAARDEVAQEPTPARLLTVARAALVLRRRRDVCEHLAQLLEASDEELALPAHAFLPLEPHYEQRADVPPAAWFRAQATSGFVRYSAPTGLHQGADAIAPLAEVARLSLSAEADERRLGLLLAQLRRGEESA